MVPDYLPTTWRRTPDQEAAERIQEAEDAKYQPHVEDCGGAYSSTAPVYSLTLLFSGMKITLHPLAESTLYPSAPRKPYRYKSLGEPGF
jgi:hypothetical protein